MNKLLLIDGNSMLFRAYYGTLSRGVMASSTGVVTNAVYGFSTMLNKAIEIIEPTHVLVAFDTKDKTFRHDMFDDYKGHRKEVDENLVSQFALVREFLDSYPMVRYELSGYEADDIIGTLAKHCVDCRVEILTSDRDMLQLIDDHVDILLMRKGLTDLNIMTREKLMEEMGVTPSQIVDIKALQGDVSDNIPGVPSIGEKTALKLIGQYGTLDSLYEHKDEVKGKMGEKLREFEDQARLSYALATIDCDVPLDINMDDLKYEIPNDTMNAFYRKYDMNSLITKDVDVVIDAKEDMAFASLNDSWHKVAVHPNIDKKDELQGVFITDGKRHDYLDLEAMKTNAAFHKLLLRDGLITSTSKVLYRFALDHNLACSRKFEDVLLLAFICDASTTTMAKLKDKEQLWFYEYEGLEQGHAFARSLLGLHESLLRKATQDAVYDVYETIEKPLTWVLAQCEFVGINVDQSVLDGIAERTLAKIEHLTQVIYDLSGVEFNINSPKQLGEVLFDDLKLPTGKKRSTAVDVLEGLADKHPIIEEILTYRKYQKFFSTYAEGLQKYVDSDHRIHTIFSQTTAQTGRLSSTDPNLQNISIRDEDTRKVRQVFVADEGYTFFSADYSQIELRVLAHMANEPAMITAFNENHDIHSETAMRVFDVPREEVTSLHRRHAKAVNFGIIYGISDYGLANQLGISPKEAGLFIKNYLDSFSHIEAYMKDIVAECEKNQYVTTLFNRRRYLPEINDRNFARREAAKRAAMNAPIQGTAADLIKMAMVKVNDQLHKLKLKSKLILQVHDELLLLVSDDEKEIVSTMVIDVMTNIFPMKVKLEVSSSFGKTWYEVK
ncbi:MAG: DNA polymerase I [Erysipelothrix sp.]|nr:DNA polymerase I [Erysipelothrix sp.]